ncbi:PREDICTED: dedicator of cytokinesis protein 3-like isoform X2 [Branchiostoma belcheri]|uniref:Dedicator of cytokinesis protein 3-like isoform X2 n=1 Tax=Branchiostoma belcheri TaxID=7741 RepID=A0A6P4YB54_BRABE|nr:PREDICTED: dedicator of cytokinesis protein 3-like isoform X2 [Branchiostoma belcheri]
MATWSPTPPHKKYGVAIDNYVSKLPCGVNLQIGETVQILEECAGWYRGFSLRNKEKKGVFPASYVHLKEVKVENIGQYETVSPVEDPTVLEVTSVLREWGQMWKRLYVERQIQLFHTVKKLMLELIQMRRQLMSGTLTQDQIRELKLRITSKIDWGNRKLGLDLVPRIDGEVVDVDRTSAVQLYQVHLRSQQDTQNSSSRGTVRKSKKKVLSHHLYFILKNFACNVGEDTDIFFSLYDAGDNKFISERFHVKLTKNGLPVNVEKLHSLSAFFIDLGNQDLARELYMVAHIFRIGKMVYSSGESKKSSLQYRRPYGCAVLSIQEVLVAQSDQSEGQEDKEFLMKVYSCNNENEMWQLHENIIRKQLGKVNLQGSSYGMVVSMSLLHGELAQVRQENAFLFNKGVTLVRKLGFSDVIMPGDIRNDLYVTLERAEFEKGGKTTGKNVEVTMVVLGEDGEVLQECISLGEGEMYTAEYQSYVLYHNNNPRWGETIKLAIPIDKFYGSHLRFEFRHCSTKDKDVKKLFGFAFTPLMIGDGTTLQDRQHELFVYKCEENVKFHSPAMYLTNLPSSGEDTIGTIGLSEGGATFPRSPKETFVISTVVCSTKLTQNVDLLGLLKWKAHPDRVQDTLQRLTRVDGEDIVKFLHDILDTLFAIMDENTEAFGKQVFQVLVFIIDMLHSEKFQHFREVLDTYIQKHFSGALVYKELIACFKRTLDTCVTSGMDKQEQAQNMLKAIEYIFKFIIQSRVLYGRATCGQEAESFKDDFMTMFTSINRVLAQPVEALLQVQVTLLKYFHSIYDELLRLFNLREVAKFVANAVDSIPLEHNLTLLNQTKLKCVEHTIKANIFRQTASRAILLPTCLRHLSHHMRQKQELKLGVAAVGDIIILIQELSHDQSMSGVVQENVQLLVDSLLELMFQGVMTIDRTGEVAGHYVSCLIGLLGLMNEEHYRCLLEGLTDRKKLRDFLLRIFIVFRELVKQDHFPRDWVTMRMLTNNVVLTALQYFSQALTETFLFMFDQQLWSSYFGLAVAFLTQASLQLESFTEAKRNKILEKYSDMRVPMGFEILSMWQSLGEHKLNFLPGMVGSFLEISLVPETELRKALIPVFHDMMECEQATRGSFKEVECEMIDKLDILISQDKGDDEYRELFHSILLDRVQVESAEWQETAGSFVNSMTRLLERLLDYRHVMKGSENRDKRMGCTVSLLHFYHNDIQREEMYIRYIYKLHDMHREAENYTEAGFTLLLHAGMLGWTGLMLPEDEWYPRQQERERKEKIYVTVIEYFDKGKSWENGIPLCKELAEQYEKKSFEYAKLSHILQTQAHFFENILTELRPERPFYRVGYYGKKFPFFLRNKTFVYQGQPYEKIQDFSQRLQTEFPNASFMTHNLPLDDEVINSDVEYIQICKATPVPKDSEILHDQTVPEKIASYYRANNIDTFVFDRPVHKGAKDENLFKNMWLERTIMVTTSTLPGILKWFEVKSVQVVEISPIETAIQTMDNMNKELRTLIHQHTTDQTRGVQILSMRLNGVIDAAVNGGISKYQEAFFEDDYITAHPEDQQLVQRLKGLVLEQVSVLESGLAIHGKLAPAEVVPLHRKMVEMFTAMKASLAGQNSPSLWHTQKRLSVASAPGALGQRSSSIPSIPPSPEKKPASPLSKSLQSPLFPVKTTTSKTYAISTQPPASVPTTPATAAAPSPSPLLPEKRRNSTPNTNNTATDAPVNQPVPTHVSRDSVLRHGSDPSLRTQSPDRADSILTRSMDVIPYGTTNRHPGPGTQNSPRSSWAGPSVGPPIPPRTGLKGGFTLNSTATPSVSTVTTSTSQTGGEDSQPPALPARVKRASAVSLQSLDSGLAPSPPLTPNRAVTASLQSSDTSSISSTSSTDTNGSVDSATIPPIPPKPPKVRPLPPVPTAVEPQVSKSFGRYAPAFFDSTPLVPAKSGQTPRIPESPEGSQSVYMSPTSVYMSPSSVYMSPSPVTLASPPPLVEKKKNQQQATAQQTYKSVPRPVPTPRKSVSDNR